MLYLLRKKFSNLQISCPSVFVFQQHIIMDAYQASQNVNELLDLLRYQFFFFFGFYVYSFVVQGRWVSGSISCWPVLLSPSFLKAEGWELRVRPSSRY